MADNDQDDKKPVLKALVTYGGESIHLQDDADLESVRNDVFNAVHRGGDWVKLPTGKGEHLVFVTAGTSFSLQSQQRSSKPRMARVI